MFVYRNTRGVWNLKRPGYFFWTRITRILRMHVFRNTAGVWNLTNDYYRPTDQREVMTIIDPLTVVNSTSCYSVDSVDSCSFIETPGVFEISKDPAIFFEHESHESYEWPLRGNTAGVWKSHEWPLNNGYYRWLLFGRVWLPPLRSVGFHRVSCSFIETPEVLKSHEIWRILALIVIR